MARTRSAHNSKERYYAILQAAERLFGERGYQGVSVEEIARAAGVSKGLVIYHFTSKENLLVHVLSAGTATLFTQLDSVVQTHKTAKEKIRAAVEIYLTIAGTGPALTRMAMMATFDASYSENLRKMWLAFLEQNLGRFAELVDEGIANGEFKQVDSQLVTQLVMAMAFELLRLAVLRQEPLDAAKAASEVTKILFHGICR